MRVVVLASLFVLAGCATAPVTFQLDVRGPAAAQATIRALGATTDSAPRTCATPCAVEFAPDMAYEVELRAPGYQRARVQVSYQALFQYQVATGDDPLVLRIPLLPAPRRPDS